MSIGTEVINSNLEKVTALMSDCLMNPKFDEAEIEEQKRLFEIDMEEVTQNPQSMLPEILLQVAYQDQPLGKLMTISPEEASKLTSDMAHDFHESLYRPERMIISAVGVEHQEFVDLIEKYFVWRKSNVTVTEPTPSKYIGGEYFQEFTKEQQEEVSQYLPPGAQTWDNLVLAWEAPPMTDKKRAITTNLLEQLLGSGGSFSVGGPGKGMHSRLYQNVLNGYHMTESVSCFYTNFPESGIFGIHATYTHNHSMKMLNALVK